ncbi:MAG: hypothetical protein ACE5PM_06775, partial [Candidatus Hydrothermarchaeales archaeon]
RTGAPTIMPEPKETEGPKPLPPSILSFSIPDEKLPKEWIKTREASESAGGISSLTETISPRTLPTTVVTWYTYRDPYKTQYKEISTKSTQTITLTTDKGEEITAVTIKEAGLYKIATHIGFYTFVASTTTPENIDNLEKYGTHEEVVNDIFLTGVNLAMQYDLSSL